MENIDGFSYWHVPPKSDTHPQASAPVQQRVFPGKQGGQDETVHFGAVHFLLVHVPLAQSVPVVHASSAPQRGQARRVPVGPPQSTPVSVPFFTPSVHVGAWHVIWSTQNGLVLQKSHTPLVQSRATLHV
jgi:hypothetical protein